MGDVEVVDPSHPRAAAGPGPDPGGGHHRPPTPPGRPTTSTPTPWPGAVAAALGAEKLVFLTDVAGLRADPDDPATLLAHGDGRRARGHGGVGRRPPAG